MTKEANKGWQGSTDGTPWMQRSLVRIAGKVPLVLLYGIVALVIPFYMILDRKGYKASYRYFRQRIGYGPVKSFFHVFLNEYNLGKVVIDRFAMYGGRRFDLDVEGYDLFHDLSKAPEGFLMLSSHVGNFELAGYSLPHEGKSINALVYAGETETISSNRVKMFSRNGINIFSADDDMAHIFRLNENLSDGNIVCMAGDRSLGSSKVLRCDFLGGEASFPKGPFALAVSREAPTLAVFVMKRGVKSYKVYVKAIHPKEGGNNLSRMQSLAADYAACLESIVRMYPDQWYNFYDFWQ